MERSAAMRSARGRITRTRCVILIACSAGKRPGGVPWIPPAMPGVIDQLPPDERRNLIRVRRMLTPLAQAAVGPDVGDEDGYAQYLPACERYTGRLYQRVESSRWPKPADTRVIIVSALYGLLFPWEPIQSYDLTMISSTRRGGCVYRVWRERGLGHMLAGWCARRRIVGVLDLLTKPYRAALADLVDLEARGIERVPFDYPRRFQASNVDRGNDMNSLLQLAAGGA